VIGPEGWAKPNTPCAPLKRGDVPPSPIKGKGKGNQKGDKYESNLDVQYMNIKITKGMK